MITQMIRRNIKMVFALSFVILLSVVTTSAESKQNAKNHISHYSFGKIVIDGTTYEKDIVIWPNELPKNWPADLHDAKVEDFEEITNSQIKTVIYGAGDEGAASLRRKVKKQLKSKGLKIKVLTTHDAVKFLNENDKSNLIAVLHLNC